MNVTLTWDLFVIVFFTIIIAYSFIVGRNQTLKIIIGAYIASLTADALTNLVDQYLGGPQPILKFLDGPDSDEFLIMFKIVIFILVTVVLAVRGGFEVGILGHHRLPIRLLMTFLFGFLNAGLIVSTLLLYISGLSLINAEQIGTVASLGTDSPMVALMIQNHSLWFSLPAIAFVVLSFVEGQDA